MTASGLLSRIDGGAAATWARRLVVVGAVVVLGLVAARLFWLLTDPRGAVATDVGALRAATAQAASGSVRADLSILTRINPFSGDGPAVLVEDVVPDAPETALNLTLVGLRSQVGGAAGSAVIKTPDNLQKLYEPGDEILDNVALDRVLSDRVILSKNGQLETLYLNEARGALSVITDGADDQQVGDEAPLTVGEPSAALAESEGGSAAAREAAQAAPESGEIEDAAAFMRAIRLDPVRDGDATVAYRLLARDDGSTLRAVGLQGGDIVTAINGVSVADIDGEEFVEDLEAASGADLTVDRDGETLARRLVFGRRSP